MKRLIVVAVVLAALGGMMAAGWLREPRRWSTADAGARAAFEECLDAEMKFYRREALAACERALQRDPGFAVAKLKVALFDGLASERSQALLAELRAADLDGLRATERFLIRYWLLRADRQDGKAEDLLTAHLREHPDDPFALDLECRRLWEARQWDAAEACHTRLLAVDPNWVQAQNRRGYAAMAQGRFDEAEKHFRTYLFVAPDQANPHDSLAELLTLRGRYREAEQELERAIEVRPDFCAAYDHLVSLHLLAGDAGAARRALGRGRTAGCVEPGRGGERSACSVEVWEPMLRDDWEGVWTAAESCGEGAGPDALVLGHRAALETGREAQALEIEEEIGQMLERERAGGYEGEALEAMLAHLRGSRALHAGRPRAAIADLRAADRLLRYWDVSGAAVFKLYNLAVLAAAEESGGDERAAAATRARLAAVNPRFLGERPPAR